MSMDATMPPPKSAQAQVMRVIAFEADAVSWTETPLGDDASAVIVLPGITVPLVTRFASGTLMR